MTRSPGPEGLFDPGLQPERTALSWRRTALALLGGALVGGRLLAVRWGGLAWLVACAGVVVAAAVWTAGARRSATTTRRLVARRLTTGEEEPLPDGRLLALTTAVCLAAAGLGAVLVVTVAVR